MEIDFNGTPETIPPGWELSLQEFLAGRGLDPTRLMVELNGAMPTRDTWEHVRLRDGDVIIACIQADGG